MREAGGSALRLFLLALDGRVVISSGVVAATPLKEKIPKKKGKGEKHRKKSVAISAT